MLSKVRNFIKASKCKGFTLIEALVSSAIFGLGFVGVYTIVAVSEQTMIKSVKKQQTQAIAEQIMDIISTDVDNIDSYAMDLDDCVAPATADQWDVRAYQWCLRLNDIMGSVRENDNRSITVTTIDDDVNDPRYGLRVVHLLLEGDNENVQIVMKRTFDD